MSVLEQNQIRRPDRYSGIAAKIRRAIAEGSLAPGARLPSRRDLANQFKTTVITVQKAIGDLEEAGFVQSRGWEGSFVSFHPPHLYHFGLVLPDAPDPQGHWHWSTFLELLNQAIADAKQWAPRRITTYCGVWDPKECQALRQLERDMNRGRLAGLVICANMDPERVPLVKRLIAGEVPVVTFGSVQPHQAPKVELDQADLLTTGLSELRAMGGKRLAVAMYQGFDSRDLARAESIIQESGMELCPGGMQGFAPRLVDPWVGNWIRTLAALPAERRPDAIFVQDEAFSDAVRRGLVHAGLKAGRDVLVVSHCNFPARAPAPEGFRRIGWNIPQAMKVAVKILEDMRQGKKVPNVSRLALECEIPV